MALMTGEPLGALLARVRARRGYSQMQMAKRLCEVSGMSTVTRHEVSRWEREERLPSRFWLEWISRVTEVPVGELEQAREQTSGKGTDTVSTEDTQKANTRGSRAGDYARQLRDRSLALVTLKFEHRATSVQLSGTYEQPEQAQAVIGMFERMVMPGAGGVNGAATVSTRTTTQMAGSPAGPAAPSTAAAGVNGAAPSAGSLAAGQRVRVPMGIRYTSGPGVSNGNGQAR